MTLTIHQILSATDVGPNQPVMLKAGPTTVRYENGDIRYIRLGDTEILRRVYAAIRDQNWGTVPFTIKNENIVQHEASFTVTYDAHFQQPGIDYYAKCSITGSSEGDIVFRFEGEARSDFKRNRIGFCVLHPMDLAGDDCTIEYVDGRTEAGCFPQNIAPHQPYKNLRAITHEVVPGIRAEVRMEGDTFEMEDQRNWTDASYKTYCTPLALPFPAAVQAGDHVTQQITIKLLGDVVEVIKDDAILTVTLGDAETPLPLLGLGIASHGQPLSQTEITRLQALNLSHLRIDLDLGGPDVEVTLRHAMQQAATLNVALELALHLSDDPSGELAALADLLAATKPTISRYLIFKNGEKSTAAQWVQLAKSHLKGGAVGGGTDAFFTELNRERPDINAMDLVTYSLNPQVHAFDDLDLVETLAAQQPTVQTTKSFSGSLPVVVSPVTLKMRWNPNATGAVPDTPPGELPPTVDPRQMSLFGAVWTLGSIKYLSQSGVHSATYYETTGMRGVMAMDTPPLLPDKFPALPGSVYPMYYVFLAVGEFAGGHVVHSQSSTPLLVDALVLRKDDKTRVLLGNMTRSNQTVTLPNFTTDVSIKRLNADNAEAAMRDPDGFYAAPGAKIADNASSELVITLGAYEVVVIDD